MDPDRQIANFEAANPVLNVATGASFFTPLIYAVRRRVCKHAMEEPRLRERAFVTRWYVPRMTPEVSRAFARYNRWMNAKVFDAAARLSDEERKRDRGAFFGSIHNVMNHILVGDRIWLGRLTGRVPDPDCIGVDGIKSL